MTLKSFNDNTVVIFVSILFLLLLTRYFFSLTESRKYETFANQLDEQKRNYLIYEETLMDEYDQNIDELYKGYSGEGKDMTEWKHMNLHQCIDRCNNMENCIGFSRENINDTEKGSCYPRNILSKCHSSRKGNFDQRQNAIQYNTYLKHDVANQMTKCIGSEKLTLNRIVLIKCYAHPNKYVGLNNNKVELIEKNANAMMTFLSCKFKITIGLEGSGTISLQHVETSKYLYRDDNDILVCKNIDKTSTDERQRSSFYLLDGLSNQIVLKCMLIRGEKMNRYISCDRKGRYLKIITNSELNKNTNKYLEYLTFDIVDYINNNKIIKTKEMLTNLDNTHMKRETFQGTSSQSKNMNEDRLELYQYLDSGMTETDFESEIIENNEQNSQLNIGKYKSTSDIDSAFDTILNKDRSNDSGESVYENAVNFNKELFESNNGIMAKTKDIENKINNSFHNLDKMRIQDMSRDYFYLKNVVDSNLDESGDITSENISSGLITA